MSTLLLVNKNTDLNKIFHQNFIKEGYKVTNLLGDKIPKYQRSFLDKLLLAYHRIIHKNPQYIHCLEEKHFIKYAEKQIKINNKKFDYTLVFRGDLIPISVLEKARKQANCMVGFQLDGVSVSEKILDRKKYFDQIFVFDPEDVASYPQADFKFLPNCWFPDDNAEKKDIDLYYLGSFEFDRHKTIESLHKAVKHLNLNNKFLLLQSPHREKIQHDFIDFFINPITYKENLEITKRAKVLLDFKRPYHNGLSLRFFEAMAYNNKIVTNNATVRDYDFYHPDNIYVTDYENFEGLEEFLQKPYIEIPKEVKLKYRFDNWVNQIFNLMK